MNKYSSLAKLKRFCAYVVHYLDRLRSRIDKRARHLPVPNLNVPSKLTVKHYPRSVLNVEDYREALMRLVHFHQSNYFSEEIKKVSEKGILPLTNKLAKLGSILVSHRGIKLGSEVPIQILRLGGRVRAQGTHLAEEAKSPYLLHPIVISPP
jgi:hypothetical protein